MKLTVKRTHTRVPNQMIWGDMWIGMWQELTGTAIKLLLFLVSKHQQEDQHSITVRVTDKELAQYLFRNTAVRGGDRETLHRALRLLGEGAIDIRTRAFSGYYHLLHHWKHWHPEDGSGGLEVVFDKEALELIGIKKEYALVSLAQARNLSDPRSLTMLIVASQFLRLWQWRTMNLEAVRELFGLTSPAYDDWRAVDKKLKRCADDVTLKTNISVKLIPHKEGRRVTSVEFLSNRKRSDQ